MPIELKALTYDRLEHATSSAPLAKQTDSYDRFISMLCYGGAFHESAFKNPNTCALTSSDSWRLTWGLKFNNAAFKEIRRPKFDINNDGQTNLMETLLRVLIEDDQNFPMQQTSSMAFADSILKEGPILPILIDKNWVLMLSMQYPRMR